MSYRSKAYNLVLWISEKGLQDVSNFHTWVTLQMRGWLGRIDDKRLEYDLAIGEQYHDLVELELLKQTIELKAIAESNGGFSEEHGPALANAANALYDHCGWEDDDVATWFGGLVMGEGGIDLGLTLEYDEEDEDD